MKKNMLIGAISLVAFFSMSAVYADSICPQQITVTYTNNNSVGTYTAAGDNLVIAQSGSFTATAQGQSPLSGGLYGFIQMERLPPDYTTFACFYWGPAHSNGFIEQGIIQVDPSKWTPDVSGPGSKWEAGNGGYVCDSSTGALGVAADCPFMAVGS